MTLAAHDALGQPRSRSVFPELRQARDRAARELRHLGPRAVLEECLSFFVQRLGIALDQQRVERARTRLEQERQRAAELAQRLALGAAIRRRRCGFRQRQEQHGRRRQQRASAV